MRALRTLMPPPGVVTVLTISNLARTVGNGFLLSVSVLYFIRAVHVPAGQVGLGLTVSAVLAMAVSIPAGQLSDRLGSRTASLAFGVTQGLLVCGYALAGGFAGFLAVVSLTAMADSASTAARGALIADALPQGERVRARAYLQSVINVGLSGGTLLGGVALSADSRTVYTAMLLGAGALFTAGGLTCLALPPQAARRAPKGQRDRHVLRDVPYLAVSLCNAVLVLGTDALLTAALPIWIADRTQAPVSVYAAIMFLNTAMCVLFQVRLSRGAEDVRGGARAMRRSGVLLAVACGVFALSAGRPAWVAVGCLLAGALAQVIGEMLHSAGSWALSYELAPAHAHGQYQGLYGIAQRAGSAITPVLTAALLIGWGWPGWLVFAAVLLAGGLATPAVARWAERNRPFDAADDGPGGERADGGTGDAAASRTADAAAPTSA
ncbi:MFS transporter [Streptomyces sp. YGL11-2]|uniref:MFS transporter n=1 Tax=Streptomyces sp. YGL11-2 TaxID=3414028 RepID=UPI003CFA32CF